MVFYFALSSSGAMPKIQEHLQSLSEVAIPESEAAVTVLRDLIQAPMRSGEVAFADFHQVVALVALVKICCDATSQEDSIFTMSDEAGLPVFFDRDEDWRAYLTQCSAIPAERMEEAQDLFVAYGVMSPILDLSTLAMASTAADDFCL